MTVDNNTLKIGGASGFWGDSMHATAQLLQEKSLDYIVYDYLAEITMSILARARANDATMGYATSFLTEAMLPNLKQIADNGVKIIANAGGVNSQACAQALTAAIAEQGLELKVAWVEGDDLISLKESLAAEQTREMFSGEVFPDADTVQSINAYIGAFPIVTALDAGADIVITGRCVDSAVTLAACIHHFDWQRSDLDQLAMGSLAGHILECGPQATGGNFTDWDQISDRDWIGYPIAEVSADGSFICTKPANTGGLVNIGTVAEQMVYEIGDPQNYVLPDVICDFSTVTLEQAAPNRVLVSGARGRPAPDTYKVSATYADQFRGGTYMTFYGLDAEQKAQSYAESIFKTARRTLGFMGLPDFSETSVELLGVESQFGDHRAKGECRELVMKIAAKHPEKIGVGIMLKEAGGLSLATPPGLSGFGGNRPKVSPVVRLFSFLVPKSSVQLQVHIDGESRNCVEPEVSAEPVPAETAIATEPVIAEGEMVDVPLIKLAWGRSGDKGDKANVGIIARKAEYFPHISNALSEEAVASRFAHFLAGDGQVEKFVLPGINGINFLLHDVLGGGGIASLRNDPQGKGYAQVLLACPIPVPESMAENLQ